MLTLAQHHDLIVNATRNTGFLLFPIKKGHGSGAQIPFPLLFLSEMRG